MAKIVVESSHPARDDDVERRIDAGLRERGGRRIRTYLSRDGKRRLTEIEAGSVDVVGDVYRDAGVPYDRAWTAIVYAVEDYPELLAKVQAMGQRW